MSDDFNTDLPHGFSCKDCFAFKRFCSPMGIAKPEQTRCDYYPVRFHASVECLKELAAHREGKGGQSDWAIKQLPLVMTLKKATEAINQARSI